MSRTITGKDVFEAIKKNGYPHIRGQYGGTLGACAIGQAALNLGVDPYRLDNALAMSKLGLSRAIVHINDDHIAYEPDGSVPIYHTYDEIVREVKPLFESIFNTIVLVVDE